MIVQKITTKYPYLNKILDELNFVKTTSVYSFDGRNCYYNEFKTEKDGMYEPLKESDLELLYEKLYDKIVKE